MRQRFRHTATHRTSSNTGPMASIVLWKSGGPSCSTPLDSQAAHVPSAPHSELTLAGRLRVGINFGNALLAKRDADGVAHGIAIDLAQELARRLDAPFDIVNYASAGKMADGARAGAWDVAFLATDPDRATEISFTQPYLEVDTTYLVPAASPLRDLSEVDREGVRIAVSAKSAYDLV